MRFLPLLAAVLLSLLASAPAHAQPGCNLELAARMLHVEKIPALQGCTLAEATKVLAQYKLRVATEPVAATGPVDIVQTQSPAPGAAYPVGRTVTLGVSSGPADTVAPAEIQLGGTTKAAPTPRAVAPFHYGFVLRNIGQARTRPVKVTCA